MAKSNEATSSSTRVLRREKRRRSARISTRNVSGANIMFPGTGRSVRRHTRSQTENAIKRIPRRIRSPKPKVPRSKRVGPPKAKVEPPLRIKIEHLQPDTLNASLFFKLPRELRDRIYDELWSADPIIRQRYMKKFYVLTYGRPYSTFQFSIKKPNQSAKHAWLLTNKQILHEGIQQFHQKSTWHFDDFDRRFTRNWYEFPLLTPSHVQALYLHVRQKNRFRIRKRDMPITLEPETQACISRMGRVHSVSEVQKINVNFYKGSSEWKCDQGRDKKVDFTPMEVLAAHTGVKKYTLQGVGPSSQHLIEEIERVGKLWIGRGFCKTKVGPDRWVMTFWSAN